MLKLSNGRQLIGVLIVCIDLLRIYDSLKLSNDLNSIDTNDMTNRKIN